MAPFGFRSDMQRLVDSSTRECSDISILCVEGRLFSQSAEPNEYPDSLGSFAKGEYQKTFGRNWCCHFVLSLPGPRVRAGLSIFPIVFGHENMLCLESMDGENSWCLGRQTEPVLVSMFGTLPSLQLSLMLQHA